MNNGNDDSGVYRSGSRTLTTVLLAVAVLLTSGCGPQGGGGNNRGPQMATPPAGTRPPLAPTDSLASTNSTTGTTSSAHSTGTTTSTTEDDLTPIDGALAGTHPDKPGGNNFTAGRDETNAALNDSDQDEASTSSLVE